MKTKRTIATATALAILAGVFSFTVLRGTQPARAQTDEAPPTVGYISFGMLGITQGQTIRLSVVNAIRRNDISFPPGPTRVTLTFLDSEGNTFRHRDGSIVRRVAQLERGQATFLDFNSDDFPPGPTRVELRAVVNVSPIQDSRLIPYDSAVPSMEIFNNGNVRTVVSITNPGVIRGFNPQPDPPL